MITITKSLLLAPLFLLLVSCAKGEHKVQESGFLSKVESPEAILTTDGAEGPSSPAVKPRWGEVSGDPAKFLDVRLEELKTVLIDGEDIHIDTTTPTILLIARAVSLIDRGELSGYEVLMKALDREDDYFRQYELLASMSSFNYGRDDFHGHLAAHWGQRHDDPLDSFLMGRIVNDFSRNPKIVAKVLIRLWERSDGYFREDVRTDCVDRLIWESPGAVAHNVDRLSPYLGDWLCEGKYLSASTSPDPGWESYRANLIARYQRPHVDPEGAKKVIALLDCEADSGEIQRMEEDSDSE